MLVVAGATSCRKQATASRARTAVVQVACQTIASLLHCEALHSPLHDCEAINQRLGRMSGGPGSRWIEEGLTRLEFVGIVYEHRKTFELVFARSAAAICADDTLAT